MVVSLSYSVVNIIKFERGLGDGRTSTFREPNISRININVCIIYIFWCNSSMLYSLDQCMDFLSLLGGIKC